ncbi:hypothetical protein Y023_5671 [Burkholderia pseudomallei A79D]|nr:hypothetical protein Y023_5671 [Burkholderia pseudomallei A79D]KGX95424.1 hypothetical protein X997_5512 [Burkholderia pseudomallei A79C]
MHQADNVAISTLRQIAGMYGQCVGMGVQIIQLCRLAIGRPNPRINAIDHSCTRQFQHIPKHYSPVVTGRILPCNETVNPLGDVALIQGRLSMSHPLAFDAQIGFLVPELMQEAKDDIDPAKHLGIVIAQVQQFELACDLKIGQAEFFFQPPHGLFYMDRDRDFQHPGLQ